MSESTAALDCTAGTALVLVGRSAYYGNLQGGLRIVQALIEMERDPTADYGGKPSKDHVYPSPSSRDK